MKRILQRIFRLLFLSLLVASCNESSFKSDQKRISELKELHKLNLEKSPFKEQLKLSKKERKALGLPPNKYLEEMWELTMNPELGRPTPGKVLDLQKELMEQRENELATGRVPGDAMDNMWIERGPNNVGGRTRAVMFDPNDTTDETVFAGGVSGGLWRNTNISNANSQWERVAIPENLAISCIAYDPNDTDTFYVGTGESYVGGDVNGSGVWKSEDGGETWFNVFGGISGDSYFQSATNLTINSPGSISGDYFYIPSTAFGSEISFPISENLVLVDDGTAAPTEACNFISNGTQLNGKIALIRRGNCNFDDKVKRAQDVGAIAVIMMNNVDGDPIPMGGDDTTITIPAVMISKASGDLIESTLNSGQQVTGTLNPADGDFTGTLVPGIQHINDIVVRNNLGVSEIYVGAGDAFYRPSNAVTYLGGTEYGLYKSVDGGLNWVELTLPTSANGNKLCPNDIEIAADNDIWVSTTNSVIFGDGGGLILSSTDGTTFSQFYEVPGADRTQIAASSTDPNKFYVLAELSAGGVTMKRTFSAFIPEFSVTDLSLPNDADNGIPANDFTRQQAFYNLMLEVDPLNDDIVYTGGIDLFKSTNEGNAWSQFSHWYGGFGYQYVHADQHALAFANNVPDRVLFGNDGGVYYSNNGGTTTSARNNGYNTSQFYTVGVAPTSAFFGDYFAGGLQDNGTQLFQNANQTGVDSSTEPYGGDGAYTFFDQDGTDQYFIRNYVYNRGINLYNFNGPNVTIENEGANNGSFINPQALDSNLDILYSNYSSGGNAVVRRYSGIKSSSTLTKTSLTDPVLTATPTAFSVSPYTTSSSKLLVGTVLGDILLVENANGSSPTWSGLDGNLLVGSVSDVEFGQNENEIFVTMHNYGVNNIWYTNDQGSNWQAKDGNLPDLPVKSILQNPLNTDEVMIGTELGVWYSKDFSSANPTWNQAFNGMSNVKVLDLDLRNDNTVFAATYGRGVFSGQLTAESLSLDETITNNGITIFPTVSDGSFTVRHSQNYQDFKVEIYNLGGQRVYTKDLSLSSNNQLLNLNLSSGMYFARFSYDGFFETKKIIIK